MILVPKARIDEYTARGWWGEQTLGDLFIETALRQPEAAAGADAPNRMQISGETLVMGGTPARDGAHGGASARPGVAQG